jgi:O-antigen ligase
MTNEAIAIDKYLRRSVDRAHLERAADWVAIAVAVSLPWSTSLSGILIGLWCIAVIPTLNRRSLHWAVTLPAAAFPLLLFAYGVIGMAWGGASFEDQWGSIKPTLRFLAIPLLFIQFRRSERGMWVLAGFLASCTALLAVSWLHAAWPLYQRPNSQPGVPVKDYIIQSGEFVICVFALAHLSISAWREGRWRVSAALAALALVFLLNIAFVATARSTLIIFAVLLLVVALQRFDWKGAIAVLLAGAVFAGLAWVSSSHLRARVFAVAQEIHEYQSQDEATSSGLRLEFWRKSIKLIAAAPVFGHGTGTVLDRFRELASEGKGAASSAATDQPHNQTFQIAVQLGLVGAALLFALWISHLLLFRGAGLVAWLGVGVVVQNIVSCIFNSYLLEFTLGWIYVFGVGVLGGMVLRQRALGR